MISLRMRALLYKKFNTRLGYERYRAFVRKNGGKAIALTMGCGGRWNPNYCADPFLFHFAGSSWLFYETLVERESGVRKYKGEIGCFKEVDGKWVQQGIVLKENWHMSYPQVFEDNGHVYMIPESQAAQEVMLYEAQTFPTKWVKVATLIAERLADATLYRKDGKYYLIASPPLDRYRPGVWIADCLMGPWSRHPQSDNVNPSRRLRRCGGAMLEDDGKLYRIAQDCNGFYGKRLYRVPIMKITPTEYLEGDAEPLPLDKGWPLVHFQHTYNRLNVDGDVLETIDQRDFPLKSPLDFLTSLIAAVFHNLFTMTPEKKQWIRKIVRGE